MEDAVIIDIDGVICDSTPWDKSRGPFDHIPWIKENRDAPVYEIGRKIVEGLTSVNDYYSLTSCITPIFLTARGDSDLCRSITEDWLFNNFSYCDSILIMSPEGNTTPDNEMKLQLYNEQIKGKYNVIAAIDDKLSIVKMWQSEGIPAILLTRNWSLDT